MKLAISTDKGQVSPHFGRCGSYTIIEIEGREVKNRQEIPNPGHRPGFLPEFLSDKGVDCIITGGMGPRARNLFSQKNIDVITGVRGELDDVIGQYLSRELVSDEDRCNHDSGPDHSCRHDQAAAPEEIPAGAKICITAQGKDLEAEVDPRFGRAQYFLLLEPVGMQLEVIPNPFGDAPPGAGIQAAQWLADRGVRILLTGRVGSKVEPALRSAGIEFVTSVSGKVKDAIRLFAREVR